jgi:hypothetical protein
MHQEKSRPMAMETLNTIVSRAASDTSYRVRFFEHFEAAISPYDLSPQERTLLRRITPDKFEAVFRKLEEWGQPPAAASMELMMLLFGPQLQDDEKSVTGDARAQEVPTHRKLSERSKRSSNAPIPRRMLWLFAGVVIIGLIVAVGVLLARGSQRSLENVPPTQQIIIIAPRGTDIPTPTPTP